MTQTDHYENGYRCSCGTWVPFGAHHLCTASPPSGSYSPNINDQTLVRIAVALEKIATLLEKGL